MIDKAPVAKLALLAMCLVVWADCGGETAQENTTPSGTEDVPLSKESAIEAVLDLAAMNPENKADPSTAKADLMTAQEAEDTIRRRMGNPRRPAKGPPDRLVWLVEVRGEFLFVFRGYGRLTPEPEAQAGTLISTVTMDGWVGSSTFLSDADPGH